MTVMKMEDVDPIMAGEDTGHRIKWNSIHYH